MDRERGKTGTYQWNSDFSLWKGTVIPAVLDTGINTDLPRQVIATVTENIYSSNNGNYILIPQGSRVFLPITILLSLTGRTAFKLFGTRLFVLTDLKSISEA